MARGWRSGPQIIGEVHHNRCGCASYHDPLEWMILRLVDLHVRQPSRNMNKIALACDRTEFTMLSPPHAALSVEYVCNGLLLSVVVDGGLARRLDDKESSPQPGLHPQAGRKRRPTLRARRLGRRPVELRGRDDLNRQILAHDSFLPISSQS